MRLAIKPTLRSEIIPIALIAISAFASFYFYQNFPERVPTHWNYRGEADGWSPPAFAAFFFPALTLGMYLLLLVLPNIDPKRERYEQFLKPYHGIKNFLVLFMVLVNFLVGASGLGYPVDVALLMPLGVGLLFVLIGNYLGKIKMNWFMGIRTPWTLSSEEVWDKTHRLGGKVFIFGGVLMAAAALVPPAWRLAILPLVIVMISAGTVAYSYYLYRKEQNSKNAAKR